MKSDEGGQISIEFILIVGAVLTMTVVAIPMVLKNAEMNRGLAAARDGATFGAGMRGLGFSYAGGNVAGKVKILNLTPIFKDSTSYPGTDWYLLRFYVSIPDALPSSSVCGTIATQARSNLRYAFTGDYGTSTSAVNGSYYSFTVGCVDAD
jgi:Class III signal peptide